MAEYRSGEHAWLGAGLIWRAGCTSWTIHIKHTKHKHAEPAVREPFKTGTLTRCATQTWTSSGVLLDQWSATPYPLSPPVSPATWRQGDDVPRDHIRSHQGLSDPTITPAYVSRLFAKHQEITQRATLDPALPIWGEVQRALRASSWDVGEDPSGRKPKRFSTRQGRVGAQGQRLQKTRKRPRRRTLETIQGGFQAKKGGAAPNPKRQIPTKQLQAQKTKAPKERGRKRWRSRSQRNKGTER